ncbi:MAG: transporter substrate-binding domain-containing protein [Desulfobacterales bacterium]|nr:transporter substrate-binding domain-containing protein [Desulfobacterales bacterium]
MKMKKIYIFIFAIISIFTPELFSSVSADTIELVADEWCPYNCEPDSAAPGFIIEIAQTVFEKAGHDVIYKNVNWARAILQTRDGKHTAIVGASVGDAPDFIFPEEELGNLDTSFFIKTERNWEYTGIASLKDMSLGAIKGYAYGDELDTYISENKDSKTVQLSTGDDALDNMINKLILGRVDVIIEDKNVLLLAAKEKGILDQIKHAGSDTLDPLYIAFSPANPKSAEYAQILSDGLKELRASGKLNDILSKYGLTDWK